MKLLASGLRAARDNKRFLVGMSLLFAFRACIADWSIVPSGSMNPTLIEGDYILMNRLAYGGARTGHDRLAQARQRPSTW